MSNNDIGTGILMTLRHPVPITSLKKKLHSTDVMARGSTRTPTFGIILMVVLIKPGIPQTKTFQRLSSISQSCARPHWILSKERNVRILSYRQDGYSSISRRSLNMHDKQQLMGWLLALNDTFQV